MIVGSCWTWFLQPRKWKAGWRGPGQKECVLLWKWIIILSLPPFESGFPSCVTASWPFLLAGTHWGKIVYSPVQDTCPLCVGPLKTNLGLREVWPCFAHVPQSVFPVVWVIKAMSAPSSPLYVFFGLSEWAVEVLRFNLLHYSWCSQQDSVTLKTPQVKLIVGDIMPSGETPGGVPGWSANSTWYEVANVLDIWEPPRDWGKCPINSQWSPTSLEACRGTVCPREKERCLPCCRFCGLVSVDRDTEGTWETERGRDVCRTFRRGTETRKEHASPNSGQ